MIDIKDKPFHFISMLIYNCKRQNYSFRLCAHVKKIIFFVTLTTIERSCSVNHPLMQRKDMTNIKGKPFHFIFMLIFNCKGQNCSFHFCAHVKESFSFWYWQLLKVHVLSTTHICKETTKQEKKTPTNQPTNQTNKQKKKRITQYGELG